MTYQVSVPVVNVMHQAVMVQIVQIPQVLVLAIQDTWETNVIAVPQIIMSLLIKSVQVKSFQHTIRKVKFLSKNSILTKPQHFHEFFTIFFNNFSREIKVVNN